MSDDNKEGAGVPVAEIVTFGGLDGQKEVSWRKGKMPPVGTKLYTTPPAVMPAAPSDAVKKLGRRLAELLDEDHWAECEPLLFDIETAPRALVAKWRHAAEHLGLEGLASLSDCADELEAALSQTMQPQGGPIDMVLHCPKCHLQHVDAPDERTPDWKNEPHRSHLCHGCGHIWRPADVATNGVQAVKTAGKADSPLASREEAPVTPQAGPLAHFGLGVEQIEALRTNSLKPEEIAGAPDVQLDRVRELVWWFARLADNNANPKWLRGHAFELAYYVANMDVKRGIDLKPIRDAAFKEGCQITPAERGTLERIGFLTQPTTVQQAEVTDEQIRDGFRDYDKELVARHRTPWQIWRDSSAWTQSALKGMQPGERKEGAE